MSCPGCGLANYDGLCPVCRGDESAYRSELEPFFGPFHACPCGLEDEARFPDEHDRVVVPTSANCPVHGGAR